MAARKRVVKSPESAATSNWNRWPDQIVAGGHITPEYAPRKGYPFDVINEDAQNWIIERWESTKASVDQLPQLARKARDALAAFSLQRIGSDPLCAEAQIRWLMYHFEEFSHSDTARILSVSQQVVSRCVQRIKGSEMAAQLKFEAALAP
jgi:hypothetical protein